MNANLVLCRRWINERRTQTACRGSNMSYINDTMWSYSTEVACIYDRGAKGQIILRTMSNHSKTSIRHLSTLWSAATSIDAPHVPLITVPFFNVEGDPYKRHNENISHLVAVCCNVVDRLDQTRASSFGSSDPRDYWLVQTFEMQLADLVVYCDMFNRDCSNAVEGLTSRLETGIENARDRIKVYWSPAEIEKRKRRQARQDLKVLVGLLD